MKVIVYWHMTRSGFPCNEATSCTESRYLFGVKPSVVFSVWW